MKRDKTSSTTFFEKVTGKRAEARLSWVGMREVIVYEPATGLFWRKPAVMAKGRYLAGSRGKNGHTQIKVLGCRVAAHRLAWFYYHGKWPVGSIDHINGDPTDNRIANIRDVPHAINMQNRRTPSKGNKTGFLGVSPHKGKFVAGLSVEGRRQYLGIFDTPEEAHEVYLTAKRKLHAGMTL